MSAHVEAAGVSGADGPAEAPSLGLLGHDDAALVRFDTFLFTPAATILITVWTSSSPPSRRARDYSAIGQYDALR